MQVGIILDDQYQQPDRQGHLDEFTKKEIDWVRSLRTLRDPAQAQREQKIGEHAYDAAQACRNRSMKPCPSARDRNRHSGRYQLQNDHSEQLCNPKKRRRSLPVTGPIVVFRCFNATLYHRPSELHYFGFPTIDANNSHSQLFRIHFPQPASAIQVQRIRCRMPSNWSRLENSI